jgi:hypothetical protein
VSAVDDLAAEIVAAAPIPVTRAVGKLVAVRAVVSASAGLVVGVTGVDVRFESGTRSCEWLGSFAAEVIANQPVSLTGRDVLVEIVGGRRIVTGVIWTGA